MGEEVGHVDGGGGGSGGGGAVGGNDGWEGFGAEGGEEGGVVEDVGEHPEAEFPGVGVDAVMVLKGDFRG